MKKKGFGTHFYMRGFLLLICALAVLWMIVLSPLFVQNETDISSFSVRSDDGAINISWKSPSTLFCQKIQMKILNDDTVILEKELDPLEEHYSFIDGEHGKKYKVEVQAFYHDGSVGSIQADQSMFLHYSELPDLPLLIIDTMSQEDPTYEIADKPDEKLWGETITNNEYVTGIIQYKDGEKSFTDKVKIKNRGNTSCTGSKKKPYKIVLKHKQDLFNNGKAHKNWILRNTGTHMATLIGAYVSQLCGLEWQIDVKFANVILNGDWKGCYYLTEDLDFESAGNLVEESGYIFENSAYWWKPNAVSFKTQNQKRPMGYLVRYPKHANMAVSCAKVQGYMQKFEDCILAGDPNYINYIDEVSFAKWILVRDIMGCGDGGGSNQTFYIKDLSAIDASKSKIKMGPLWDCDAFFDKKTSWSSSRGRTVSYFPQLFEMESFSQIYRSEYNKLRNSICNQVCEMFDDFCIKYGEAMRKSYALDNERWGHTADFDANVKYIIDWFPARIQWMNEELGFEVLDDTVNSIALNESIDSDTP